LNPTNPAPLGAKPAGIKGSGRNMPLVIGFGCLGLLVVGCLFVGAVVAAASLAMRSSDPYKMALAAAQRDPVVITALGAPVEPGWFTTGRVEVAGSTGQAALAIPISGPRGSAKVEAQAEKVAGSWKLNHLSVHLPGTSTPTNLLFATSPP
jgi:hypothetical protein